jgi:hypothetical protein
MGSRVGGARGGGGGRVVWEWLQSPASSCKEPNNALVICIINLLSTWRHPYMVTITAVGYSAPNNALVICIINLLSTWRHPYMVTVTAVGYSAYVSCQVVTPRVGHVAVVSVPVTCRWWRRLEPMHKGWTAWPSSSWWQHLAKVAAFAVKALRQW